MDSRCPWWQQSRTHQRPELLEIAIENLPHEFIFKKCPLLLRSENGTVCDIETIYEQIHLWILEAKFGELTMSSKKLNHFAHSCKDGANLEVNRNNILTTIMEIKPDIIYV